MKHYFKVSMVAGHQGTRCNKRILTFYYEDTCLMNAVARARKQGGVKHTQLPVAANEIDYEEYAAYAGISAYERAGIK